MRDSRDMRDNRAILSALYTVLTEAYAMRRDAEAREIMQGYPARDSRRLHHAADNGARSRLGAFRWSAPRAPARELEAAGFRTRIRTVERTGYFD